MNSTNAVTAVIVMVLFYVLLFVAASCRDKGILKSEPFSVHPTLLYHDET